ncbi:DUF4168 domain-containing protein [Trichothermofontia sp.]
MFSLLPSDRPHSSLQSSQPCRRRQGGRSWLRQLLAIVGAILLGFSGVLPPALARPQPLNGDTHPPAETAAADVLPNVNLPTRIDSSDISAEKVNQFIQAYLQVVALIDQRQADLQGADSELESLRLQQEIEAQAQSMIRAAGLTPSEYLQLLNLAHLDPEFGERVVLQIQEQATP